MPASEFPYRTIGRLTIRWISSFAITYLFITILMASTAQQRVAAALEKRDDSISYSSAFVKVKDVEEAEKKLADLRSQEGKLSEKIAELQRDFLAVDNELSNAWGAFVPIAGRIPPTAECTVADGRTAATLAERRAVWGAALDCARNGNLTPRVSGQILAKAEDPNSFERLAEKQQSIAGNLATTKALHESVKGEAEVKAKDVADAQALNSTFDELDVLRGSKFFLGAFFVEFPPSLLQILLAFLSGTFGALLITLVLVVYPQSQLASAAGKEYGARLLLGGLIAVGTYVLLGGGSAVLGNRDPFGEAQANYMTFCAVGVLAGMFSDRVAAWLSERANAFFSKELPTQPAGDPPK